LCRPAKILERYNCDQLEDIYELAKGLGSAALHLFMLVPVGCGQWFDQKEMLNAAEYEEMMLKIAELGSRRGLETFGMERRRDELERSRDRVHRF